MNEKTMKENVKAFAVRQVLRYLDEDPDKSLPSIMLKTGLRLQRDFISIHN